MAPTPVRPLPNEKGLHGDMGLSLSHFCFRSDMRAYCLYVTTGSLLLWARTLGLYGVRVLSSTWHVG